MKLQSKIFWECVKDYKGACRVVEGSITVYEVTLDSLGEHKVKYLKTLTASSTVLPCHITHVPLKDLLRSCTRNILEELADLQYNGNLVNYRRVR